MKQSTAYTSQSKARNSLLWALWGLVLSIVLTAALAPWIYTSFSVLPGLSCFSFERVSNRLALVMTALIFYLFREKSGIATPPAGVTDKAKARTDAPYFFYAAGVVAVCVLVLCLMGFRILDEFSVSVKLILKILTAAAGGLAVGLIEEYFFRVYLYERMKTAFSIRSALIISSLIYSLVHFIQGGKLNNAVNAASGFTYTGTALSNLLHPSSWISEAVGIFLLGILLCTLYEKKRSLYAPAWFHAGAVFAIKCDSIIFDKAEGVHEWFTGGNQLAAGILCWTMLLVCIAAALNLNSAPHESPAKNNR